MAISLDACPLCGGRDIYHAWPEAHFDRCRSCLLYFRNPMPTESELSELYERSWSMPARARAETGGTDDRLAALYARKLAQSLGRKDFSGLRVLDFGAGRGAMIRALSRLGASVCAIEPFGLAYLQSQGFDVYRDLSELEGVCCDGVVMIDVLEHLPQPLQVLRRLREKLTEGGWIYIATPNPLGANARIRRSKWREARKKGHLLFPSESTMQRLLRMSGFGAIRRLRWYVGYHGFPRRVVDYVLQNTGLDGELRYLASR